MIKELNRKLLLIVNPVSGKKVILPALTDVIRSFMEEGYSVTTMVTGERGEATDFAVRYAKDYNLIVCAGGDGTINETITGLASIGLKKPIGYIPCGSTNDFANAHNLSLDIQTAAKNAATGAISAYDIGQFDKKCFVYVAAFGAFSGVSYNTDQNLKNAVGHAAYIMSGFWELAQIRPIRAKITADGKVYEDDFVFGAVCNTNTVGATLTLPDNLVDMSDGKFELLLIRMPEDLIDLEEIVSGLFDKDYSSPLLELVQAKEVRVETPEPLEWALDGEASGAYSDVTIKPIPKFLQLRS